MQRLSYFVTVVLAIAAIALDAFAFSSRCSASPGVNLSLLIFGAVVQAVAIGFPLVFGLEFAGDPPRRWLAVIGMALLLLVGGSLAFRYSALYSDAIGQPNYFRSAGLACRSAG